MNVKPDIIKQLSQFAVLDNAIIQKCRYEMTAQQDKILLYMISKVKPHDIGNETYSISIRDYCSICEIALESGKNYDDLKKAVLEIDKKYYLLKMPDQKKERRLRWFNRLDLNYGSGIVEYSFHNDIIPYVFQLQREYTQLPLTSIMDLRSKYSIKIYKLLKSYANMRDKRHEWYIEDFKKLIGAENYTRYPDLRRYVLEQAKEEINYKTDLRIDFKPERKGTKGYNTLVFEVENAWY